MNKEEKGFLMNLNKGTKLSLHMNYKEKKNFFEYEQRYNTPCELQNDIECYGKIMESHPNYPAIIYTYILKFRQMLRF